MATEFSLPDRPPPGNMFPVVAKSSGQRASVVTLSKGHPRAIVVEVKDDTPRSSEEADHSSLHNEPTVRSSSEDADDIAAAAGTNLDASIARSESNAKRALARPRQPPPLTIHTGPTPPPTLPVNTHATHSQASSLTLHEGTEAVAAADEDTDQTPVMRSMFPRFDPSVRMSRQDYSQAADLIPPPPPLPAAMRLVRPCSQMSYVPIHHSPMTSPQMVPRRVASEADLRRQAQPIDRGDQDLSSPEELLDLWTIANGQLCPEAKESYTLGLECDSLTHGHEEMQFTSSTGCLYRLHASADAVVITRTHPMSGSEGVEMTIATPLVRTPSTTSPLLATLFPALAELLALDTASSMALTNGLSRQNSTAVQAEALRRARAHDAASLLWDSDSSAYFFTVPSLARPTAPLPQALAISIVPARSIVLLDPARRPLLSLDLHEAELVVHTAAIVELSASLYTLDLLVSALLTLLLHLHRHTALLTPYSAPVVVPHFAPPPKVAVAASSPSPLSPRAKRSSATSRVSRRPKATAAAAGAAPASSSRKLNRWLSRHSGGRASAVDVPANLLSPRSASAYSSPYIGSPSTKDLESALEMTTLHPALSSPHPHPALARNLPELPDQGVAPELKKEITGVDLSRFQAYDLSDPELGRGTRIVLRVVYWSFGVLVWILGVAVGILAALVVGISGVLSGGGKKEGRIDGGREG